MILKNFPSDSILNYWDESLTLLLIIIAVLMLLAGKAVLKKADLLVIMTMVAIVVVGLISNLMFRLQPSGMTIIRDIVGFVKFPACFSAMRIIGLDDFFAKHMKLQSIQILRIIVIVEFLLSIISLFKNIGMSQSEIRYGIRPFEFLFSHPTYLVLANVFILVILDSTLFSKGILKYEFMLLIVITLSMRTKGIAIVLVYMVFKYAAKYLKRAKWLVWPGAFLAIYVAGISKVKLYLTYSGSPRQSLYEGAFKLMKEYFPIGSGFGTFGSMLSGSNSSVYNFIGISGAWINGELTTVLGDAGYAYFIGQFGFLGCLLYIAMFYVMYKVATEQKKKLPGIILLLYVIIALTTEATTSNAGTQIGIILSIIIRMEYLGQKNMELV